MSKHNQTFKPLSLAQYFEAPEGFRGSFGWVCGFSADSNFADDAAERFTQQTHAQRALLGRVALALILDPGNPQISLVDVPGVMHLQLKNPGAKPFRLMHAKVALLGFRHESDASCWQLRLIVSTGNWTRQTLEESLDLVWVADLSNENLENPSDDTRQICADIKAAWDFLGWLGNYFDKRILDVRAPGSPNDETVNASRPFESWVNKAAKEAERTKPRFFDNRRKSLMTQLPEMIKATGVTAKRNYLGMGSGFFETPSNSEAVPSILGDVIRRLQEHDLLTAGPEIDVFVNPRACQAVASSTQALKAASITVRPANQPAYFSENPPRALHAKFIFSANYRENSLLCNSAWLYLGSGNLTGPGFRETASENAGNLEAGIVFVPNDLYWEFDRKLNPELIITNVLPVQWEKDSLSSEEPLSAGESMPERNALLIAAPTPWLLWCQETGTHCLMVPVQTTEPFEVLDDAGEPCPLDANQRYSWPGKRPRQVQLRWMGKDDKTHIAQVPVVDEFGRIAASDLQQISPEEAWEQLADFPMLPDDEDSSADDDWMDTPIPNERNTTATSEAAYPVRRMMQLIENIAAKQISICKHDWFTWCSRIEQSLMQTADSPALKEFMELRINPISPLWHPPFRPSFAETGDTPEGQRYENALRKVEEKWSATLLKKIGESLR